MADPTSNAMSFQPGAFKISYQMGGPTMAPPPLPASPPMSVGPIPAMNPNVTFLEIAQSGLRQFSGWVREEFLTELIGRQGARTFNEMCKNSAICGAIMFAVNATMRKVEWRVDTADDTPASAEAADFVDSCREDMSHTWEDLIAENLSMLQYGYAPHELVYKRRLGRDPKGTDLQGKPLPPSMWDDGLVGWRKIPIRGQDTVLKWFFGQNGEILGMTQQPWNAPIVDLPIDKMLLFRPSQHKGNPEGLSILRSAYRSYFLSKRLEEQEAILFERMSGLPVMKVPTQLFERANGTGPDSAAARQSLEGFRKLVTNTRVNEQMGILIPSDMYPGPNGPSTQPMYGFELVAPQGARIGQGLDQAISRYNVNMLTSVLADFIMMGHDTRGAQNLAVSKIDLFFQAVESYLNSIGAVYNRYALPRLWTLNGFDFDTMPKITPDLAQRVDLDLLSAFLLRMAQSGMPLFPDLDLENTLRDFAGLPDITEEQSAKLADAAAKEQAQQNAKPGAAGESADGNAQSFGKNNVLFRSMIKRAINRRLLKQGNIVVNTGRQSLVTKIKRAA